MKSAYPIAALAAAIAVAGLASAATPSEPTTGATAVVAQISVPGQASTVVGQIASPPSGRTDLPAYAYPGDGSVLTIATGFATAATQSGSSASGQSAVSARSISIFNGEITVEGVSLQATAAAGSTNRVADTSASFVTGLVVLGRQTQPAQGVPVPLADWGTLYPLRSTSETPTADDERWASGEVVGLLVRLTADHGGLPAGSEIQIGRASVEVAAEPAPDPTVPAPAVEPKTARPSLATPPAGPAPRREPGTSIPGAPSGVVRDPPSGVVPTLSTAGYVFPVYGPATFGDTFGAPRADIVGGWHHGEDIFAPEGTPLLAVVDGTVFSVGWNEIGGWRLWLRDGSGNEFYYAHLSAYSTLAVDGTKVKAGSVLGFMGKTGDAEHSPAHLHFEIHPVELLSLGYDGVIAPYPYLLAWRRAEDVSFAVGRVFVPAEEGSVRGAATHAGAILMDVNDISASSGLVPGAIQRAARGAR